MEVKFMTIDKVKEIISEQLAIDASTITENSKVIADLGADSLDIVELIMALEDEFGVSVDEDKVQDLVTVGDIVRLINEQ